MVKKGFCQRRGSGLRQLNRYGSAEVKRVKNLFDEDYWGEVREEGIMPALPRNYYGGFEIFF